MKTLLAILIFALPAQAISTDSFWFYSQCPAQYASCAGEVLKAQTAHKACAYLVRYHGYEAVGIVGISETDARNGRFVDEADCEAKRNACWTWLSWVQGQVSACEDTLEQVR